MIMMRHAIRYFLPSMLALTLGTSALAQTVFDFQVMDATSGFGDNIQTVDGLTLTQTFSSYAHRPVTLDHPSNGVDAENGHVYVLSKRTVPAELYQLPLHPEDDDVLEAAQVAILDSLPQPNENQLRNAMQNGWGWQPTGMDLAPDGRSALILTYDGINYFARAAGQSWPDAFAGRALHLALGRYKKAEAISYTDDSAAAMVTIEAQHAPLLRIRLEAD